MIGGIATSRYGLRNTALVYSLVVAAFAAAAAAATATATAILQIHRTGAARKAEHKPRYPDPPAGPCTVPPCPPR